MVRPRAPRAAGADEPSEVPIRGLTGGGFSDLAVVRARAGDRADGADAASGAVGADRRARVESSGVLIEGVKARAGDAAQLSVRAGDDRAVGDPDPRRS
ncbi:hypothetical protein [Actinomadura coerulea]|uniref:hypothetical protein n=1 Tax=Actinomadura coerulea TaxID=46159 RepID=UPI0034293499